MTSEAELIARFFAPLATDNGADGLRDDAATLKVPGGQELVINVDALVEGRHFFSSDSPADIARKALRVNLSDLVAKGAVAHSYLLTLMLPDDVLSHWLSAFCEGLAQDQETYGITLLGGDTVSTPGPLSLSVTMHGFLPEGQIVRRRGARAGDVIFVTGTIGDAALGLQLRQGLLAETLLPEAARDFLLNRYLLPQPRMTAVPVIGGLAKASMDISDGLMGDLSQLAKASNLAATVYADHIPLSDAARIVVTKEPNKLADLLTGGDDYEILAAIAPDRAEDFRAGMADAGVFVTEIGVFEDGTGVKALDDSGSLLTFDRLSFSHTSNVL